METFNNVFQAPYATLQEKGFDLKGHWRKRFFKNDNPIILELGCGKGEYTVGLGRLFPNKNFIGIDIKGARIWKGAKEAIDTNMPNIAFLRTSIEFVTHFFGTGEVDEIWITFPDPQMKKVRKRLTSTRFLELYRQIMNPNGVIHLKTDSNFLYTYTNELVKKNKLAVEVNTNDLYNSSQANEILSIKTFYESQWLNRGIKIKYLRFHLHQEPFTEPEVEIDFDDYRSFGRGSRSPQWQKIIK